MSDDPITIIIQSQPIIVTVVPEQSDTVVQSQETDAVIQTQETTTLIEEEKVEAVVESKQSIIEVSQGIDDHSKLSKLGFEESGHTGFQKALTYDNVLKCYLI